MSKFLKIIKAKIQSILSRPWSFYLMFLGFLGQGLVLVTPSVLAQDNFGSVESYTLSALSPFYFTPWQETELKESQKQEEELLIQEEVFIQPFVLSVDFDEADLKPKIIQRQAVVTAYSSTFDQTDSSPFITASGSYVHDGIVACNFLPFGTKVRFPEYSGDKIYIVEDRMAKKNSHKIDIWMPSRAKALDFGVKILKVEILED